MSDIDFVSDMTDEEMEFALHFYSACEEGVGFSIPKPMRYRLRELGLMEWKGGNYFEVTEKLNDLFPLLIRRWKDWYDKD